MANKKSLIGSLYMPIDNSYQANLSNRYADERYLAGTYNTEGCITTIVSEPFNVPIISIHRKDKTPRIHEMIIVEFENQTYIAMFHEWGLLKEIEVNGETVLQRHDGEVLLIDK